jgi:hypothetical protein
MLPRNDHRFMKIVTVPFTWSKSPRPRRELPVVAPLPRPFDFGFTARCPLVPLPAAMLFLNKKQRAVIGLIESGDLRWAFDIRSASASTREIRVLRDSLFEYTRLRPRERFHESDQLEFADISRAILPEKKEKARQSVTTLVPTFVPAVTHEPAVTGVEVAQCFSCSTGQVRKLLRENLLRAPGRRRPGDNVLVLRASVIEFLWKRRMT